jgi:L-ascorbate metabolism protein UlaG (beta-lactamase superfamily)
VDELCVSQSAAYAIFHHVSLPTGTGLPDFANGSVMFIGNATVLIRYAGFTILTDPTFIHIHEQVSIGYGMHSTRLTNPAMEISDLPPLDLIILPHFHGDHVDQVAERDLDKTLPIVTHAQAAKELGRHWPASFAVGFTRGDGQHAGIQFGVGAGRVPYVYNA